MLIQSGVKTYVLGDVRACAPAAVLQAVLGITAPFHVLYAASSGVADQSTSETVTNTSGLAVEVMTQRMMLDW